MMNIDEFQENIDKALLYKKAGKLADSLNLYKELYVLLVKEAADYAKCIERPRIYEADNPQELTPKFFKNAGEYLRSDNLACIIFNNICLILAETGQKEAAKKYFKKSIKYLPGGMGYPDYEIWLEK